MGALSKNSPDEYQGYDREERPDRNWQMWGLGRCEGLEKI
jgi:hypothetical protein